MQIKGLTELFDAGALNSARAGCCQGGIELHFTVINRKDEIKVLETQRGEVRKFKTFDSALKVARSIGFTEAYCYGFLQN